MDGKERVRRTGEKLVEEEDPEEDRNYMAR